MTMKYKLEVSTSKGILLLKVETTSKSLLDGILNVLRDSEVNPE